MEYCDAHERRKPPTHARGHVLHRLARQDHSTVASPKSWIDNLNSEPMAIMQLALLLLPAASALQGPSLVHRRRHALKELRVD